MISFVLLNWNSKGYLDRCIRALEQQTSREFELIAVDNGSTNASLDQLRRLRDRGTVDQLIELPENHGFAAGMNAGIARASGNVVVALNSDVTIARNFVDAVNTRAAAAPPTVGMWVVPEYVWRWNDQQDELTEDLYTVGVSIVRRLTVSSWHPDLDDPEELLGPQGPAMIFSMAALEAARAAAGHVFDETYGSYSEDIDLLLRIRSLGYRPELCLETAFWHVGSASVGGLMAYEDKPVHLQAMVQLNRLRNFGRLGGVMRWGRVLPWIVADDLFRLVTTRRKLATLKLLIGGYGRMGHALDRKTYDLKGLRFGGRVYSRSARVRSREELPPLPIDLKTLMPQ